MFVERLFWFFLTCLWAVLATFILITTSTNRARAEHPAEHMNLHDVFYNNWNRPDIRNDIGERKHSCCNKEDCAPVNRVEYRADGTVWALRTKDQQWIKIPEKIIESNQNDPRESPDGFSHMCSAGSKVYCFVLGSAT